MQRTCTPSWYCYSQRFVSNGAHSYYRLIAFILQSINPATPSFFKAKLSPYSKSYKPKPGEKVPEAEEEWETMPRKLQWKLTPEIRAGVRFAETRISDLICQNDSQALEFKGYGKNFITRHGFSPDAFVQMAFQAAYYGLYGTWISSLRAISAADASLVSGRVESTYEPAMTKAFLHGRTEAIRTVQPESVHFVKVSHSMPLRAYGLY
jgi:carnitine O-acetyltransferase